MKATDEKMMRLFLRHQLKRFIERHRRQKYESAKLIDFCQDGKANVNEKEWNDNAKAEANRLWSLAQTAYEEAAMWAVKAATYGL